MSRPPGRHPTDADRERGASGVLEAALDAVRRGDRAALASAYADEVVWLAADGRREGAAAAADAHLALGPGLDWAAPQQQGARAVLRWTRPDAGGDAPSRGAVVVEVRRGRIIFAAAAP